MEECIFKSSLANILIQEKNRQIIGIKFTKRKIKNTNNPYLLKTRLQILEYLKNKRKTFNLKINPPGTVFQKKVWKELEKVKYGKTQYYSTIAKKIKTSPRAVGNACGANKCLLIIPCHRIISKSKKNGGFSSFGGMVHKDLLLSLEKKNK
jgi:methylated-DNA-[protein]-cysteine S-methyltransferase